MDAFFSRINVRIQEQPMAKICQETRNVPKNDPRMVSGIRGLKRASHPDKSAATPILNKIIPQRMNLNENCSSKELASMMRENPRIVKIIPDIPIFFLPYLSAK